MHYHKAAIATFAIALAAAGCNNTRRADSSDAMRQPDATQPASERAEGSPISVTGCLQQGGGITRPYILTQINRPATSVGTDAPVGDERAVEREQLREARNAYRLDGDKDLLQPLLGKQVTVSGVVEDASNLGEQNRSGRDNETTGTTGSGADISLGDLAKIQVRTAQKVGDSCSSESGGQSNAKPGNQR